MPKSRSPAPIAPYGRYTPAYRARVLRRMEAEGFNPHQMARILAREAVEKAMDSAEVRDDGSKVVQPAHRTPTGNTIRNWQRHSASHLVGEAVRLHRACLRVGPVTGEMLAKLLELLGWDDSEATDKLGATHPGLVEGWREGEVRIPGPVAAHVRTLAAVLAGHPPRPAPGVGGVEEKELGTHSAAESPPPHTSIEFD